MIKLSIDFQATLDLGHAFSGITSMTRLMPFENGRAVAFGWATVPNNSQMRHQYWLAELTREGVSVRVLSPQLTHSNDGLLAPLDNDAYLKPFKFGEQFGVLLSSEALLLFSGIHDEPVRIPIENHFSGLGVLAHPTHTAESHYQVMHCGSGTGDCVPVIFAAPGDRGAGRCLSLLKIDTQAGRARWLHTAVDGSPFASEYRCHASVGRSKPNR